MSKANLNPPTNHPRDPQLLAIAEALSAPFEARDVKFKPQLVRNDRALALAYVDARLIQDRLDRVLGVENWQDNYELLADGSVICRLKLKFGTHWITKTDVGSPSEQPDSGDRLKAAFSDALKRAAVKFGIGRYLYRLQAQWVEYDPAKKQLTRLPQLPAHALPKANNTDEGMIPVRNGTSPPTGDLTIPPSEAPKTMKMQDQNEPGASRPTVQLAKPSTHNQQSERTAVGQRLPSNGQELHRRLLDYDAKIAAQKLCQRGALIANVTQAGVKAGYSADLTDWTGPAITFAVEVVREFEHSLRRQAKTEANSAA